LPFSFQSSRTGLSPFTAPRSSGLPVDWLGKAQVQTPQLYLLSQEIRFALCRFRSLLLTASQLLSLPAGTKMLQSTAFPLLSKQPKLRVAFGDPGVYVRMQLTRAYRSLPRPSSASGAEPSTKWLAQQTSYASLILW